MFPLLFLVFPLLFWFDWLLDLLVDHGRGILRSELAVKMMEA